MKKHSIQCQPSTTSTPQKKKITEWKFKNQIVTKNLVWNLQIANIETVQSHERKKKRYGLQNEKILKPRRRMRTELTPQTCDSYINNYSISNTNTVLPPILDPHDHNNTYGSGYPIQQTYSPSHQIIPPYNNSLYYPPTIISSINHFEDGFRYVL